MANQTASKRPCVYPSDEMVAWIELAATYERAGLGNNITEQTEQVLQQMVCFLTQPAQVYAPNPSEET